MKFVQPEIPNCLPAGQATQRCSTTASGVCAMRRSGSVFLQLPKKFVFRDAAGQSAKSFYAKRPVSSANASVNDNTKAFRRRVSLP